MFTAVAGIVGALAIGAWAVVSWASTHRLPWLMAPLALLTVVLLVAGMQKASASYGAFGGFWHVVLLVHAWPVLLAVEVGGMAGGLVSQQTPPPVVNP